MECRHGNCIVFVFFFFNDTATTEIYTLSLHDALPISAARRRGRRVAQGGPAVRALTWTGVNQLSVEDVPEPQLLNDHRSEEHTSELQSRQYLVCRLLLEKKKLDSLSFSPPTSSTLTTR